MRRALNKSPPETLALPTGKSFCLRENLAVPSDFSNLNW